LSKIYDQVGRIKFISLNEETQDLEVTILISDPKFKKKILRDLSLSGNLTIDGDKLIYESEEKNAKL
jgi:hypothetical protein